MGIKAQQLEMVFDASFLSIRHMLYGRKNIYEHVWNLTSFLSGGSAQLGLSLIIWNIIQYSTDSIDLLLFFSAGRKQIDLVLRQRRQKEGSNAWNYYLPY